MPAIPTNPRVKLRSASRRVPRARASDLAESAEIEIEPTMRLSRAILVMFLLHVVAVGGFFASSLIKEHDLHRTANVVSTPVEAEETVIAAKVRSNNSESRQPDSSSSTPAAQSVHIVRPGETPMRIANENGVSLAALVAANGSDIVTTGLRTGQEIKLPEKPSSSSAQVPTSTGKALDVVEGRQRQNSMPPAVNTTANQKLAKPAADSAKWYVVGKGESARAIAQKYHVNSDALLKLNQISDPKNLKPGQKLRLPAGAKEK